MSNKEEIREAVWIGALSVLAEVAKRVLRLKENSKPGSEREEALIAVGDELRDLSFSDFKPCVHSFLDQLDIVKEKAEQ